MTEAFDYIESRDDADELITEFGQAVSLRRTTTSGPEYDPTTTTADYATKAAIIDYSTRQIDGTRILATDRRALVAAGPLTALGITSIAAPDAIVIGGIAVPVVGPAKRIDPAGTVVMYDVQLRF